MSKRIVVTGGCGFIGSNLIRYLLWDHRDWEIINIDSLTYASTHHGFDELKREKRYHFREGSILDPYFLSEIFAQYEPDGVFHLAAETHVDNSIHDPSKFIRTNIDGTYLLLQQCLKSWGIFHPRKRFLHVSTDEVYGSLTSDDLPFNEDSPYRPNSPYSATKAASDHLVRAWGQTYGIDTVTTHCSNNYGPRQNEEKFIPTVIRKIISGDDIPIYGKGDNIRDWIHVMDHCSALNFVFENGVGGESYCIGGESEWNNRIMATQICEIMEGVYPRRLDDHIPYSKRLKTVPDRPGHDWRYAIDNSKVRALGWKPMYEDLEEGLLETCLWYVKEYHKQQKTG